MQQLIPFHFSKKNNRFIKKSFLLLLSLFFFYPVFSQEKLGIANSNYSSTTGIYLNPASSIDSRTFIQLNLVGANAYAMTNVGYVPSFSVWQAIKGTVNNPVIKTTKSNKFGFANFSVDGPALVVSTGEIGIGFFTRVRAEGDIRRVPYELSNLLQENLSLENLSYTVPTKVDLNLKNIKASEMAWAEYGVNFGKMIQKSRDVIVSLGGNAKYLTGINIAYGNLQKLDFQLDSVHADLNNFKAKARFNIPNWKTGRGFGIDIGISYKKMLAPVDDYFSNSKKSGCQYIDYRYKIGLSLLDIGYLRFTKDTYKGDIDGEAHVNNYETASAGSVRKQLNIQKGDPILASIPAGLSVQADLNLTHHFYLNGTIIKNIVPTSFTGVQRANLLSITPRYEIKQVEVAIPITLEHFVYPQLGFAFRIRTFVLGFDNILPLIAKTNTYVLNAYFNLGVSMFKNPSCRQKKSFRAPHKKKVRKKKSRVDKESKFPKAEEKTDADTKVDCPKGVEPDMVDRKEQEKKEKKEKRKKILGWLRKK